MILPNEVIIGQRRQGKSTLALAVAGTKSKVIVIFDPNHNYRMPGIIQVESPLHLQQLFDEAGERSMVLRIGPFDQEQLSPAFAVYSEVLWRYEDYALIIDESHMLQTPQRKHAALDRFIRRCPADVYVIQTAHRLMELHSLSRYLCDDLRLFRNEQPRELDLIEEQFTGVEGETVKNLGDRQHVHWHRDEVGNPQWFIQRDAGSWYIDLHNPNRRRDSSDARTDSGGE